MSSDKKISRRKFVSTAAAVSAFTIVPRHVLGGVKYKAPSEKLNIAGVGVGGMGGGNIKRCSGENIVALCDVDSAYAAGTFKSYPKAKTYSDYREMFDKQKDIDAVVIATPDHTHAVVAMAAIKAGKHVYVQKPLTFTVKEARMLTEAAREAGVATQMGNQGRSGEGCRLITEWIADGAIGEVTEVDAWTDRPIWRQGLPRPTGTPAVPDTMNWDLWIGPAPMRPYNSAYHPKFWRGYWDFGTGALGDMACHILDPAFMALDLKYPTSFEGSRANELNIKGYSWGSVVQTPDSYPTASKVHYEFPKRGDKPAVTLNWYDGGLLPRRPEGFEDGRRLGDGRSGLIFHGSKGKIMCGCYGASPRLIPETEMRAYKRPEKTIERISEGHEQNWINACKGGKKACSNFEVSGPLTETVLAGNLAIRLPGRKIKWDGENMKVTNNAQADAFVHREYREGWSL
jgi:predicted dehydrogenase